MLKYNWSARNYQTLSIGGGGGVGQWEGGPRETYVRKNYQLELEDWKTAPNSGGNKVKMEKVTLKSSYIFRKI